MITIPQEDDGKNWARLILNRMEYGRKYCHYSVRLAHEVLGLPVPEPVKRLHVDATRAACNATTRRRSVR